MGKAVLPKVRKSVPGHGMATQTRQTTYPESLTVWTQTLRKQGCHGLHNVGFNIRTVSVLNMTGRTSRKFMRDYIYSPPNPIHHSRVSSSFRRAGLDAAVLVFDWPLRFQSTSQVRSIFAQLFPTKFNKKSPAAPTEKSPAVRTMHSGFHPSRSGFLAYLVPGVLQL